MENKDIRDKEKWFLGVTRLVTKYLHHDSSLVGDILADYLKGEDVHVENPSENYNINDTRVSMERSV